MLLTELVWQNILQMRKTSQPVEGAPKRDFMPQTDDATNWKKIAAGGQLNFKEPTAGITEAKIKQIVREEIKKLKEEIKEYGLRNSLLLASMPTASTAQILGNNECFEPFTSNMYMRRVLSGEFPVVNKYLLRDLVQLGLWNNDMKNKIMLHNGSIQNIDEIPDNIKAIYKTVWEIKQRDLIDMAADRGAFIDQSQSLNIFMESPTFARMTSLHFYAWEKGLKTGMYYLRSKAGADAVQFTVDNNATSIPATQAEPSENETVSEEINPEVVSQLSCSLDNPEGCEACGS